MPLWLLHLIKFHNIIRKALPLEIKVTFELNYMSILNDIN